ncbi:MAG: hypothetical protein M3537_08535 [Chloroflexota bacterium]|nr:hypothetical protein [Chloroflexota bacterium]
MPLVNVAHLHLLLNHVPTVGTVIGVGLFLLSLVRRNDHLRHASLEVFFLLALATLPVYLTGMAAQEAIAGRPDVSAAAIAAHHDGALLSFILMEITGFVAWLALWQFRRLGRPAGWTSPAILLLSVVMLALMASAATVGGEIRHPEIKVDESAIAPGGWITAKSVEELVTATPWIWPTAEALHFIGLSLLFGVLFVVNLRLLGALRTVSFASLHRLLPWGMLGFGVNLVTGMMFFIAAPTQYVTNGPFYWKVLCLMVGGADLLYLTVFDKLWALEPGDDAAALDKAIAATAIAAWVGVIFWGRMLPFLGNAF